MNKKKTAQYISRFSKLSIALKSARYKTVGEEKILVNGQRITFDGGYYETEDLGIISALEEREDFGSAFVRIPENKTTEEMRESMKASDEKDQKIAELKRENDVLNKKINSEEGKPQISELLAHARELGIPHAETMDEEVLTKEIKIAESSDKGPAFDE